MFTLAGFAFGTLWIQPMNRRETIASTCGTISLALAFILAATHNASDAGLLAMFAAFALCAVASFMMK